MRKFTIKYALVRIQMKYTQFYGFRIHINFQSNDFFGKSSKFDPVRPSQILRKLKLFADSKFTIYNLQ